MVASTCIYCRGVNPGGLGGRAPRLWAGVVGSPGVVACREILYLIMYKKYLRKW